MGTNMSSQRELSNEYQHDRIQMVIKNLCILVLWAKVALVLDGLGYCAVINTSLFSP